jgi:ABC-2 type transport system ATP-binding protein
MIQVQRVSKWFGGRGAGGVTAVDDVSFTIPAGQCVGLLGPNGAGKSTTIRMITGFLPPSAGTIRVNGQDTINDTLGARAAIGYLPESTPLYPEMRVRDYLSFRAKMYGLDRTKRRSGIAAAMERCWLNDVAHRRIGQLSKGYRQRVGLAAALVHSPPVLILDEPTSGLDPTQIRETRSLIKGLAEEGVKGRTVLVSSHILPEVEQTCDRVIIIARGRVRADGAPGALVRQVQQGLAHTLEVHVSPSGREKVHRALAGLPGIVSVQLSGEGTNDQWARFVVTPAPEVGDVREPIARAVASLGVVCRELHRSEPTLEQVFMRVIESDERRAAAAERERTAA